MPIPFPIPSLSIRSSCRRPPRKKKTGKAACRSQGCAAWCRGSAACVIRGSIRAVLPSIAKCQDSTRASCSTKPIISTGSCTRCECATCARWDSRAYCFPASTLRTTSRRGLQPQLLVERLLELEQRRFVVQARAVEKENVLGAIAEGVDLRACYVDVGGH